MGKGEDQKGDELNFELRKNINDAYAFVEGAKSTQTFATVTFEDLMDQQIERLVGKDTDARPNPLHRIDKVEQNLKSSVAKIKSLPPEAFVLRDKNDSVNTPEEGDDPEA
jgi:hypothetical protein